MDNEWKLPWEGGCRCGAVRFRVTTPPLLSSACHCTGCQRMTASAFTLSLSLHRDGFAITKGEPVLGGVGDPPIHYHCPACKSWMFTRPLEPDWFMNLRTTMLDDHAWAQPFMEIYRGEGFAWAATGAEHSFEGLPAPDDWRRLMGDYATAGARP
jgi:hypothetical protein